MGIGRTSAQGADLLGKGSFASSKKGYQHMGGRAAVSLAAEEGGPFGKKDRPKKKFCRGSLCRKRRRSTGPEGVQETVLKKIDVCQHTACALKNRSSRCIRLREERKDVPEVSASWESPSWSGL